MKHFETKEVLVTCDDLLHDADSDAFLEFFVLLDEGLKSSMRTMLEHDVKVVIFLDDVVAFNYVWVVQLFVNYDLLFEQL